MQLPLPPTAIFSSNNKMTLGLMRALRELHKPCPEQVSVLGFDDFEWSAYFTPQLTTIAQPAYEMGKTAMQILLKKLQAPTTDDGTDQQSGDGTDQPNIVHLRAELRIRESTARCLDSA